METWKYQVQAISVCSNFYFSLAMKQCTSHWLFGFPNIFPGFVLHDLYCFVLFILWLVMFFFYACSNYMFSHSRIASCSPTISIIFWFTASLIVTLAIEKGSHAAEKGRCPRRELRAMRENWQRMCVLCVLDIFSSSPECSLRSRIMKRRVTKQAPMLCVIIF